MDKPFKSIDEQIAILDSRGVETDSDTAAALMREGYYSIVNGYKDPFIDRDASAIAGEDTYKAGTSFNEIKRLFDFDRDLRHTMFKYFSIAEATLKTACAYNFSKRHSSEHEPYLKKENYRSERKYSDWIDVLIGDFEVALGRNPKKKPKKKEYLVHYRLNHDEVPIWVLIRYLTLGQTFKFFDFQDEPMRNAIARSFSDLYSETHEREIRIHDRDLRLAYDHIKDFRNICAHDERLYCARVSPSKDVSISGVIADLGMVLPKEDHSDMIGEVLGLLVGMTNDVSTASPREILELMGITSIENTFMLND